MTPNRDQGTSVVDGWRVRSGARCRSGSRDAPSDGPALESRPAHHLMGLVVLSCNPSQAMWPWLFS
ncbi:hypothetical protein E2C01_086550 [Portunus trituberculatus]|uniref:Uncharacterized protein n=1 Tax=Portunus trituberculatus TaxID=210409 RepID=A0A5B7J9L2_PORTR|nr:hypothetical protein [Portunus trituberculatus]